MHPDRQPLLPPTCLEVLPVKGQRAADQRVEDDSEAPDIHLGPIVFLALEELRGSVGRRATERVQLVAQRELVAEAEVGNLDVGVGIQQKVLRLSHTYIDAEEEARMNSGRAGREGKKATYAENNTLGEAQGGEQWRKIVEWGRKKSNEGGHLRVVQQH